MTESEARQRWCPMARIDSDNGGTMNRMYHWIKTQFGWDGKGAMPEEVCNCIASDCMMWVPSTDVVKWRKVEGDAEDYYLPVERGVGGRCGLTKG